MVTVFIDPDKGTLIVDISDTITPEDAKIFLNHPLLHPKKPLEELYILIKSTGGDMAACLSIYKDLERMTASGTRTFGITGTEASSGALLILLGCEKRMASVDTKFRIHAVNITRNVRRLNNEFESTFVKYLKKNKKDIPNMHELELTTLAKEMLQSMASNPIEMQEELESILRKKTILPPEKIKHIMEQKSFVTLLSEEALDYQIIHGIY